MRIAAIVQYDTKIIRLFKLTNIWMLNLNTKRDTKCETMAQIQDKPVVNLSNNNHV